MMSPMQRKTALPTLYATWLYKTSGLANRGSARIAAVKIICVLSVVFLLGNGVLAAAASEFCGTAMVARLDLWAGAAASMVAFLAAFPSYAQAFAASTVTLFSITMAFPAKRPSPWLFPPRRGCRRERSSAVMRLSRQRPVRRPRRE